jgi:ATP-dependent Clp protease adaptor protein ClpS
MAMARWFGARDTEPAHTTTRPKSPTTRTEDEVRAFLRLLPRYRVLLYNDDVNTFDHVIATLLRVVPALAAADAERIAWTAHATGCAEVIVCLKEPAEHYRLGLERNALTSTIEPV